MSKTANIQTPSARAKLAPSGRPYLNRLIKGCFVGYRKSRDGTGSWLVLAANGKGGQWQKVFALADDDSKRPADGVEVLTYEQAIAKARALARPADANAATDRPATVIEAIDAYEIDLKGRGGRVYNAEWVRKRLPEHLKQQPLSMITSKQLHQWRGALIQAGLTPASVNRLMKSARAAFSLAARHDDRVTANSRAWTTGLELLPDAAKSQDKVLNGDEVIRVVAAAYELSDMLGLYVQAHAETGSRSSQLARCVVADLLTDKLMVPASRKGRNGGRGGHVGVPLTAGLAERLRESAHGRAPDAPLFRQEDGSAWREGDHKQPFIRVAKLAGLPGVTIYALRHSSIVRLLLKGLPIRLVAEIHDTSAAIIEKHYGRFIARHGDDLIRAALIDTSPQETRVNVVKLRS